MRKSFKIILGILYWILSLTWGGIMSIPGLVVGLLVLACGGKLHKNGFSVIIEIGGNWGGINLGVISLCGSYSVTNRVFFKHTRSHEFGHSIQNIIFGPLQLFIVGIPSAIRYWYKIIAQKNGKIFDHDWYESIWFEGTASKWGKKSIILIEG